MLYVTTRDNQNMVPAQRALMENRGADGGLFKPFRAPSFSEKELAVLAQKNKNACMAEILNHLFQTRLSGWDLDFGVGRNPIRLVSLRQQIIMAECFHNPLWSYDHLVQSLIRQVSPEETGYRDWGNIAVRIAVLFAMFGELKRQGIDSADVCMVSGDFSAPISAWYARQWGLPVENIICCCNENKRLWDLMVQGQMRMDGVSISTSVPEGDIVIPESLERLICECGGKREVLNYLLAAQTGGTYVPEEPVLSKLRDKLYVSVVSSQRIQRTIPGAYATHGYLHSPGSALAYAGLLDYRAKTGIMRPVVIFADRSPSLSKSIVAEAMGMTEEELESYL